METPVRTPRQLPRPLVAWYGDDFTGASAVMEVLAFAGLPAMLFLEPPTHDQLAAYPGLMGVGVASTARTQTPEWMDRELPAIFAQLKALDPEIIHYKICSTLDSSPETGSIGRAMEIGAALFKPASIPVLVAAPQMRRYQCFGHLFAGMGEAVYRLDRHPVMSRHPVTPMQESDVARHIAKQSERLVLSCVTLEDLGRADTSFPKAEDVGPDQIAAQVLDCADEASESTAGNFLWARRRASPFVVGSQGVEYALVRHWQETGLVPHREVPGGIGRAERMVAVSGSVSPVTAEQIAWARQNGFSGIGFEAALACRDARTLEREVQRVVETSLEAASNGLDPLVYTAEGPDDPAVGRFRQAVGDAGLDPSAANQAVGEALGKVLCRVLEGCGARRAVVSGGDTSGHATRQMGIFALSALAPTIPGAALFKAHAEGAMDGLELALKGGQMGSHDYFGWIRNGGGIR